HGTVLLTEEPCRRATRTFSFRRYSVFPPPALSSVSRRLCHDPEPRAQQPIPPAGCPAGGRWPARLLRHCDDGGAADVDGGGGAADRKCLHASVHDHGWGRAAADRGRPRGGPLAARSTGERRRRDGGLPADPEGAYD